MWFLRTSAVDELACAEAVWKALAEVSGEGLRGRSQREVVGGGHWGRFQGEVVGGSLREISQEKGSGKVIGRGCKRRSQEDVSGGVLTILSQVKCYK